MKNILITGATGNTGIEVIKYLTKKNSSNNIIAGVRNIDKAKNRLKKYSKINFRIFDFENENTFETALKNIDCIFLLRPPHIANIDKFESLIYKIRDKSINEIVFLSVQGANKHKIIPHSKIERLIIENKIDYFFLRPSYFMQNLTTTLLPEIKSKRKIILPAGKAKFNWIDIANIAEVAAHILDDFSKYKNSAADLTGNDLKNFSEVVNLINKILDTNIEYQNVNPFKFYRLKTKANISHKKILVMIFLHFLPRLRIKQPKISFFYKKVTNKKPTTLEEFIKNKKAFFLI